MPRRVTAICLIVLLALGFALLIVDLVSLKTRFQEYQLVYGFTGTETSWSHRSPLNYVVASMMAASFCLIGVGIAAWRLGSKRPLAAKALYFLIVSLVAIVLFNFFQWWQSGFDH